MDSEIAKRQSLKSHYVSNSYKTQTGTATLESVRRVRVVAEGFEAARHLFNRPVGVCVLLKNTCSLEVEKPCARKKMFRPPENPPQPSAPPALRLCRVWPPGMKSRRSGS